jgi:8-oxo-dGTP pyrophosphatase MutT (NUDIX family)
MAITRYRRVRTEVVGRFPFFEVERHDVEADDAARARHDAYTMRLSDWVSIAAVTADEQFVLIRQHRHGVDAVTIEVAGGVVDAGEAPLEAALRELREETGYAGESAEALGFVHPNAAMADNRCFLFLARGVREAGPTECDAFESTEPFTMTRAEVEAALAGGAISHAPTVIALTRALLALDRGDSASAGRDDEATRGD